MAGLGIRLSRAVGRGVAAGVVVTLCAGMLSAAMPPPAYTGKIWSPFPLPKTPSVPGHTLAASAGAAAKAAGKARMWRAAIGAGGTRPARYAPGGTHWPAAGSGTAALGDSVPVTHGRVSGSKWVAARGWQSAGRLPVRAEAAGGLVSTVAVAVAGRRLARILGVRGVVFSMAPSGGPGRMRVALSYRGFGGMYGGGWASRLRLVELPACALTSPRLARCHKETPVASVNDWRSRQVTAVIGVGGRAAAASGRGARPVRPVRGAASEALAAGPGMAAAPTGGAVVLVAMAGASGPAGDFTATSLRPSGTWSEQQGAFTYSYPVTVPPALAGAAPQVALSYNSQAVDSETSGSNTQGGFIGDGWDFTPGFIERSYQGCSHDGIAGSGDECWAGQNATLSLGAHSSQLVLDSNGTWHLKNDDGTKVQLQQNGNNGLWNGEYWVVTTTDGIKYYFGADHLPGGNGSDPSTNAAWGVPVFNPSSGDPCNSSSQGQASECFMGWRWNLDFSVDTMNHVTVYNYAAETNYYSMGGAQNNGNGTLTQYVRGGYPTEIDYGYLLADAIAGAQPAARIKFGPSERCLSSASTCDANHDATHWPDVPWDQNCGSSGSCTNYSPTFWSTQRLTSITAQALESGAWKNVDGWALTQTFPTGAGSNPVMELDSITRTGQDGGTLALPALQITTAEFDNRVDGSTNSPPVDRPRITGIATEAGALITVTYEPPGCSRLNGPMPAHDYSNTLPCFPVFWTPPGEGQIQDWFLKSLVAQVVVSDQTGTGSPDQATSYSYLGNAAWHYDDNPLVPASNRTWDNYRGFQQIETTTGGAPDPITEVIQTYMQGMDGDNNGTGGTRSVTVNGVTDSDWLNSKVIETDTYTKAGGTIVKKDIAGWTYDQTADQSQSGGLPDLTAHMIDTATDKTESLFADGTWHTNLVTTYYNGSALTAAVDTDPDGSAETCTTTAYAGAPSGNTMMLDYPKQITTVTGAYNTTSNACPAATSGNIVSDFQTYYDNTSGNTLTSLGTLGTLSYPGGEATGTRHAVAWPSGGSESWQATSATNYSSPLGRVVSVTTPTPNGASGSATTGTSYTPGYVAGKATELPTQEVVTNPLAWPTTTTFDQGREQPLTVTDPNSEVTTEAYDPLGRRSYVITPIDQGTGDKTDTYSYQMDGQHPPTVITQTLREDGSYSVDTKIYDGMLELRQDQAMPANNAAGRVLTDTFYDSHGWTVKSRVPYYDPNNSPCTVAPCEPFLAGDGSIPGWTATGYDGMGRVTSTAFKSGNATEWTTTTAYPGMNETDLTPPAGGTATSSFINMLGQTTASWKYTTATPDGNASDAVVTSYGYDASGNQTSVTDNAGNTWTFGYDLAGKKTSESDPGATATSTWTYDAAGNIASATDARGQELSYKYDLLGRKTAEYSGTTSGTLLASWTYDSAPLNGGLGTRGLLASTTSDDTAGGASGGPYTETVTGYNTAYQPTGTSTAIPAKDLDPSATGTDTFTTTSAYTPLTGLLQSVKYSADDGLPNETVNYSYDLQGELTASGGNNPYLDQTIYDPFGQLARATYGLFGTQLVRTYTRDNASQRLTQVTTSLQTYSAAADIIYYTYNQAGALTSGSDTQNAGGTQTQCFQYDHLGRLTAAWASKNGTTATDDAAKSPPVSLPPGGLGSCDDTGPSASVLGGPAPYWQSYSYDLLGDRTQGVSHDTSGNTANDITRTLTYPGGGTTPATRPDTPSTIVTRRGGTGGASTTLTPGYDAAGNATKRTVTATSGTNPPAGPPAESAITYDPTGRTAKVTTSGGTSGYTYDADGSLLLQTDPTGNTVYLDGGAEQLTWNKSTGKITAQRFYPGPDGTTVVRTYDNNAKTTTITDETADPQGTSSEAIATTGSQALTRRYYDPYGNLVSPKPASWPDNHAFLGKPADPNTSLDLLGARQYDPTVGAFLSPDPLVQPGDPLALGGFAYADDNPTDKTDPSGSMPAIAGGGGSCTSSIPGCPGYTPPAPTYTGGSGVAYGRFGPITGVTTGYTGGNWQPPGWLRSVEHFAVHDAFPVLAGVGAWAGCSLATGGTGSVGCVAAGFAVYGYVHNAVDTHTVFSLSNVKAGVDTGAFGACLAATAVACGFISVGATASDYVLAGISTGQWGGPNLHSAAAGLLIDGIGFGAGKVFEQGAEAIQEARNIGAVQLTFPGGTRLPLNQVEGGWFGVGLRVASRLPQTTVNNLIRVGNYDYATMTGTNPWGSPPR